MHFETVKTKENYITAQQQQQQKPPQEIQIRFYELFFTESQ